MRAPNQIKNPLAINCFAAKGCGPVHHPLTGSRSFDWLTFVCRPRADFRRPVDMRPAARRAVWPAQVGLQKSGAGQQSAATAAGQPGSSPALFGRLISAACL